MFSSLSRSDHAKQSWSVIGSTAVHALVLLVLCLRPSPVYVRPSALAHGQHGASLVLYFSPMGSQQTLVAQRTKHSPARLYLPVKPKTRFNAKITSERDVEPQNVSPSPVAAGAPGSSDVYGDTTGSNIRPAIEVTLIDPPVRSILPHGVQGDVIVEVTIDEHGNVVGTKLLQGLGYGIDEICVATVQNSWHYLPATRDGVPIPSKYDAHWHFGG
jgi:periplasmic protein TonB